MQDSSQTKYELEVHLFILFIRNICICINIKIGSLSQPK